MPTYGASTAKLLGIKRPVVVAGPSVPGRAFPFSGTPSFGVAASQPIWWDQFNDNGASPFAAITSIDLFYLAPTVKNPVEFYSIGADNINPNGAGFPLFTQWRGFMSLQGFNLNNVGDLTFWTWNHGNVNYVTGGTPNFYTGANANGTPLTWQGITGFVVAMNMNGGDIAKIDPTQVSNPTVWPGPDLTHTHYAPPTYPDDGDGFNYFFQDGIPLTPKRPSIVKVSSTTGQVASYTSITLDNTVLDNVWRSLINLTNIYAVRIVPSGFMFTAQGFFILLSKDGSTYTVFYPVAGDATAADLFGLSLGPIGSPSNFWSAPVIEALPTPDGNFWMVSQQGSVDGVTVLGPIETPPFQPRVATVGCWPCLPVANGTR